MWLRRAPSTARVYPHPASLRPDPAHQHTVAMGQRSNAVAGANRCELRPIRRRHRKDVRQYDDAATQSSPHVLLVRAMLLGAAAWNVVYDSSTWHRNTSR